jgi:hypothetical protein
MDRRIGGGSPPGWRAIGQAYGGIWDIVAARFWEIDPQAERPAVTTIPAAGMTNRNARTIEVAPLHRIGPSRS